MFETVIIIVLALLIVATLFNTLAIVTIQRELNHNLKGRSPFKKT